MNITTRPTIGIINVVAVDFSRCYRTRLLMTLRNGFRTKRQFLRAALCKNTYFFRHLSHAIAGRHKGD